MKDNTGIALITLTIMCCTIAITISIVEWINDERLKAHLEKYDESKGAEDSK